MTHPIIEKIDRTAATLSPSARKAAQRALWRIAADPKTDSVDALSALYLAGRLDVRGAGEERTTPSTEGKAKA